MTDCLYFDCTLYILTVISLKTAKYIVRLPKLRIVEAQISLTILHIVSMIHMKSGLKIQIG